MQLINYDENGASRPQKLAFTVIQTAGAAAGIAMIFERSRSSPWACALPIVLLFGYYLRTLPMLWRYLRRRMGWGEAIGFSVWLAIIYLFYAWVGGGLYFSADVYNVCVLVLYFFGSWLNSEAERSLYQWKQHPSSQNLLFTGEPYKQVRHPNYLGDVLALTGWALLLGSPFLLLIPVIVLLSYMFYSIPQQEAHMQKHFGEAYEEYVAKTKKLIPRIY